MAWLGTQQSPGRQELCRDVREAIEQPHEVPRVGLRTAETGGHHATRNHPWLCRQCCLGRTRPALQKIRDGLQTFTQKGETLLRNTGR